MIKELIANFYELWGGAYFGEFSDQMFSHDLYPIIALYSIVVAIVLVVCYYFVLDRPRTARLGFWTGWILLGAVLNIIIAFVTSKGRLTEIFAQVGENLPSSFSSDILLFSIVNAWWTILLMFLLSILVKWRSTNSSFIPF